MGHGFNLIWRPHHGAPDDHFLQLNLTGEHTGFHAIGAPVPNRGLVQADISLSGVRYLQQIHDDSGFPPPEGGGALHLEPGVLAEGAADGNRRSGQTITRLSSIPHGNAVLAQGPARTSPGAPRIPKSSTTPFGIGDPTNLVPLHDLRPVGHQPVAHQAAPCGHHPAAGGRPQLAAVRCPGPPEAAEHNDADGEHSHVPGRAQQHRVPQAQRRGRRPDRDVLDPDGPGADGRSFRQLQYSQRLLLNFNGLSWPHVSVASLVLTGA